MNWSRMLHCCRHQQTGQDCWEVPPGTNADKLDAWLLRNWDQFGPSLERVVDDGKKPRTVSCKENEELRREEGK